MVEKDDRGSRQAKRFGRRKRVGFELFFSKVKPKIWMNHSANIKNMVGWKWIGEKTMVKTNTVNCVPVFYAADENYIPFLAVALASLKAHASPQRQYAVHVLCSGELGKNAQCILQMQTPNVRVTFHDVSEQIDGIMHMLHCRDYYTAAIFYRLFIPELFPQYDKAIYLDCDTVLETDIAQLYDIDIGKRLIGAVADQAVASVEEFRAYTQKALGIMPGKYFNSGVITLNLKKMREMQFTQTFCSVLGSYHFTVAPDQDCLNLICKNKVYYYASVWNAMPSGKTQKQAPKLIHYNLSLKPWHYDGVLYEERFWEYAKQTPFYECIRAKKQAFTADMAKRDEEAGRKLIALAKSEADNEKNYYQTVLCKDRKITENVENEVGRYAFIGDFIRKTSSVKAD